MFQRSIEGTLQNAASTFPVVVLTGPRQSGKTTLLKTLFPEYDYISLESPDNLLMVQSDPRGFLETDGRKKIIDEAQHYPELFSYIQEYADKERKPGMFILSGSQNFLLAERTSQTLAGRAAILELLPLSYTEYCTHPEIKKLNLWQFLYHGTYPRPYQEHLNTGLWYNSYIRTYLERDVRSLVNVKDLAKFQIFLKLCAGRHGQLLNLSSLGHDCGISQTTASQWLSILEASYIVYRLQPYYRNFNKRLVKTPKLFFYDTALVCQLLGIESAEHLQLHTQRGAIFEGFILADIIKSFTSRGKTAPLYFWRDHLGVEIDGLIERGEKLVALEIKSSKTIVPDMLSVLQKWRQIAQSAAIKSCLVYAGDRSFVQDDIEIFSWMDYEANLNKV